MITRKQVDDAFEKAMEGAEESTEILNMFCDPNVLWIRVLDTDGGGLLIGSDEMATFSSGSEYIHNGKENWSWDYDVFKFFDEDLLKKAFEVLKEYLTQSKGKIDDMSKKQMTARELYDKYGEDAVGMKIKLVSHDNTNCQAKAENKELTISRLDPISKVDSAIGYCFQVKGVYKSGYDSFHINQNTVVEILDMNGADMKKEDLPETVTLRNGNQYYVEEDGEQFVLVPVKQKPEGRATVGEYRDFLKPGEQYLMLVTVGEDMELRGESGGRIRSDKNLIQPA